MSALPSKEVRVELGYVPRKFQRSAHALFLTVRFLVLVWHRRAGKTVFAVMELVLAALSTKEKLARFGYIGPELKQVKIIVWDYLKLYALKVPGTVANESELKVTFPNGASVRLFGADNPESFRGGYFHGVVVDEPADIKPTIWGRILVPCLADKHGWAIFIGTPKGTNLFSQIFFKAQKTPGWATDVKRWTDTDALTAEEIETMRREMTAAEWAAEMECDFGASADDVLISMAEVLKAQRRKVKPSAWQFAAKIIGVDVGRYGGDRSAIVRRQGIIAFKAKLLVHTPERPMNGRMVGDQLIRIMDAWKPDAVFVDAGGPGASVIDHVEGLGYSVFAIDFGGVPNDERYENKRCEMWSDMGDWVTGGGCLPSDPEVAQDLTGPRITYRNKRGKKQLESKDAMRARGIKSPDYGDALALTFAHSVAPKSTGERRQGAGRVVTEYDPLN